MKAQVCLERWGRDARLGVWLKSAYLVVGWGWYRGVYARWGKWERRPPSTWMDP